MSCHIPAGSSTGAGRSVLASRNIAIMIAERVNPTAVTHRAFTAPTHAMRTPPSPGPTRKAQPQTASCTPLARSSGQSARPAAAGSIVSLAVTPAGSNTAPMTARPTSHAMSRPMKRSTRGIAATATAESTSEPMATRRRPKVSTTVPENRLEISSGSAVAAASRPADPALPVRSSTSHGRTTIAAPLPTPEISVADSSSRRGRTDRVVDRVRMARGLSTVLRRRKGVIRSWLSGPDRPAPVRRPRRSSTSALPPASRRDVAVRPQRSLQPPRRDRR